MFDNEENLVSDEIGTYYTDKNVKEIKNKSFANGVLIMGVISFIILVLICLIFYNLTNIFGKVGKDENVIKLLTVLQLYDETYVEDIDLEKMVDRAIYSIIDESGDKYSFYIPANNANTSGKMITDGGYTGLGITFYKAEDYLEVLSIVADSPAGRSNIDVGDRITHINGEIANEKSLKELNKGIADGSIKKVVFNINGMEEIEIEVGKVNSPILEYEIDDDVGYVCIHQFIAETFTKFKEAIDDMEDNDVKTIVFDLRDNGGGEVDIVSKMLDYLIEEDGRIVTLRFETGEKEIIEIEDGHSISNDIEFILLGNENTASASELFIMTLQDYKESKLFGKTTFGKGTVGRTYSFNDGSMVNISSGKYYSKNHRNIEGRGIEPDVELSEKDMLKDAKTLFEEGKLIKNNIYDY